MPAVIATPGDAAANSYCTVAEADAYHATHLYAAKWTAASTGTKETALIMATRVLDAEYEWAMWATTDTQRLLWPRTGVLAKNELEYVGNMEIPEDLKFATAELARQLIEANRTADSDIETQGITSLRAGSVALTFKDSVTAKVIPDMVASLLPMWWGYVRGRSSIVNLVRA